MKKLTIAACAALCATVGFSDVQSGNIVGYLSKNVGQNDWRMIAASFEGVSGAAGIMKITDIKCDATPVTLANKNNGAQLMIQTSDGGYTSFYYLSDALDNEAFQAALEGNQEYQEACEKYAEAEEIDDEDGMEEWGAIIDDIETETKPLYQGNGWANIAGVLATKTIDLGIAFWYFDPAKADGLSSAGQVPAAPSIDIDMNVGWTMICNPYPTAADFSEVTWTGLIPVTLANKNNGAQLMIQTLDGGYTSFYYLSDALDNVAYEAELETNQEYQEACEKYAEAEEQEDDDGMETWGTIIDEIETNTKAKHLTTGWANIAGVLKTGAIVDAGLGFWLMLPAGSDPVTATFVRP